MKFFIGNWHDDLWTVIEVISWYLSFAVCLLIWYLMPTLPKGIGFLKYHKTYVQQWWDFSRILIIWSSFFLILNNVLIFCYCDLCRGKNHSSRQTYVIYLLLYHSNIDISLTLKFWFFLYTVLQYLFTVKEAQTIFSC